MVLRSSVKTFALGTGVSSEKDRLESFILHTLTNSLQSNIDSSRISFALWTSFLISSSLIIISVLISVALWTSFFDSYSSKFIFASLNVRLVAWICDMSSWFIFPCRVNRFNDLAKEIILEISNIIKKFSKYKPNCYRLRLMLKLNVCSSARYV